MRSALVPILLADPMPWAFKAPYAWDFLKDRARFAGGYKGALANTPGWTATPATHSAGGVLYASTASGALQSFASGTLRRTDKGVLIEGARTNSRLYSQDFDNAAWTKAGAGVASAPVVTANHGVAPDGTLTADRIVFALNGGTATADISSIYQDVTLVSTNTHSVWLKSNTASTYEVQITDGAGIRTSCTVTPTWQRFHCTAASAGITAYNIRVRGGQTPVNSDAADILAWGNQVEVGAFPSSYIPTTTASATRAADVLTVPVSGLDYPLSLFAEFERAVDTGGTETLLEVDDNSAANYVRLFVNSSDQAASSVNAASASQGGVAVTGALALATVYKAAVRVGANTLQTCRGGTLGTEDTSVTLPATPTHIHFGANEAAANPCFSYLRRIAIFPRALTDAELTAVTGA